MTQETLLSTAHSPEVAPSQLYVFVRSTDGLLMDQRVSGAVWVPLDLTRVHRTGLFATYLLLLAIGRSPGQLRYAFLLLPVLAA